MDDKTILLIKYIRALRGKISDRFLDYVESTIIIK